MMCTTSLSLLPLGHIVPELLPQLPTVLSNLLVAALMRARPASVLTSSPMILTLHFWECGFDVRPGPYVI